MRLQENVDGEREEHGPGHSFQAPMLADDGAPDHEGRVGPLAPRPAVHGAERPCQRIADLVAGAEQSAKGENPEWRRDPRPSWPEHHVDDLRGQRPSDGGQREHDERDADDALAVGRRHQRAVLLDPCQ